MNEILMTAVNWSSGGGALMTPPDPIPNPLLIMAFSYAPLLTMVFLFALDAIVCPTVIKVLDYFRRS